MKKTIVFIGSILAILFAVDLIGGFIFNKYKQTHPLKGDYEGAHYILYQCHDDLVVFGSSVALNSLDTKTLGDSLQLSAYNGASNGQALYYYLSMMQSLLTHHTPQYIVLGCAPDVMHVGGVGERYNFLAPFYHDGFESIDRGLERQDEYSRWLMQSNLYRYNTIWFRILLYNFIQPNEKGECGFIAKPIPPMFPELQETNSDEITTEEGISEMEAMMRTCKEKGIRMILYFPPRFVINSKHKESTSLQLMKRLCKKYDVTFFDDCEDVYFLKHAELFYDNIHLNKDGAKIYTQRMIERLRKIQEK
jgi:hypothetical protein